MNATDIDGYRDYLMRRDGDADLLHRRLASREEYFSRIEAEPIRSTYPVERAAFLRNLRRRRPESGLEAKTLFLLATAKLNQAERFGVDLGDTYGRISVEEQAPERVYLALEEHYHTRLLAHVLDMFGLPFQVVVPPFVMRQFVKIEGVTIKIRHKVGRSRVPYGRGTPIARSAIWNELRAARGKDPRAQIHLFAHTHYHAFYGEAGWVAMTLPSLQGATESGQEAVDDDVDWGIVYLDIEDGRWDWNNDHICTLDTSKPEVLEF